MNTRELVNDYFKHLASKSGWEDFLADDMTFTSFTTPVKQVQGKAGYIESTRRFFSMISHVEVKALFVNDVDTSAVALSRYELKPPVGPAFETHVAEVFQLRDGKISSLQIYFDSAPFPK